MKVIHLSLSDISGGGFIAAYRLHKSLINSGIKSFMWVNKSSSGDWTVESPAKDMDRAINLLRPKLVKPIVSMLKTKNKIIHSASLLPSSWVKKVNSSDADLINLHWVQNEMLSIVDISKITKPIVWTVHDMWPFCGAEHYTEDLRYREGYKKNNRPSYESGLDLNRYVWQRKMKYWKNPLQIITPSLWMADCIKKSVLMENWPVDIISHPLDLVEWKPINKILARKLLNLPQESMLLLFGATDGTKDPRKGFDLLVNAIKHLKNKNKIINLELVIFGQQKPQEEMILGYPAHYVGKLHDTLALRALYSAADVMVVPSRMDMFPLTCMESLACGTPVVTFKWSGTQHMVDHKKTGYLSEPFDPIDLANGIQWILERTKSFNFLQKTREYAEANYSSEKIAESYIKVYNKVLKNSGMKTTNE